MPVDSVDTVHTPVLLQETIDGLNIQAGDVVVDGTVGGGGHSEEILRRWDGKIRLVCFDADVAALARAKARLVRFDQTKITFVKSNFRRLVTVLDQLEIRSINKFLLDLGLSSDELTQSGRGFSFKNPDEPLQMTFSENSDSLTAETILNIWSEETLAIILHGYGEERYAKKIAAAIVETRQKAPLKTVGQLVKLILAATPKSYQHQRIHAATRTFQALRIAVNDELEALKQGIQDGWSTLAPNGRIAAIAFHSLEDRIVKRFFQQEVKAGSATLVSKKPIVPTEKEIIANPRARSAKLRVIIKK